MTLDPKAAHALLDIPYARNAYDNAVTRERMSGCISGQTVYNRKAAEKRLRALLWEHREAIVQLIRDANP
jgi:hypothetical protein